MVLVRQWGGGQFSGFGTTSSSRKLDVVRSGKQGEAASGNGTSWYQLGTLRDRRFRVLEPLRVTATFEHGQSIAELPEIDAYGLGDTPAEAREDLQANIVELLLTLHAHRDRLGPHLMNILQTLSRKVQLVDANHNA